MSQEPEDQGVGLPLYPLFSPNGKAGRRPAGASAPPGAIAFGRGPKARRYRRFTKSSEETVDIVTSSTLCIDGS